MEQFTDSYQGVSLSLDPVQPVGTPRFTVFQATFVSLLILVGSVALLHEM